MPRAALYLRKSTESDDRQCLSLSAQKAWALEACAKLGLADPLIFEEAKSAKTPGRPEFARLLAAVATGEIDTVVCWKADRLARNALDGGAVMYALETKHLARIVTADRTYTGAADDSFILAIELGLSAKYSKDLATNIRRGLTEKLRRGEWPCHAPVGYKNKRHTADRAGIALDPVLAPFIRQLFKLAATGSYSISDLARIARVEWRVDLSTYRRDGSKRGISTSAIHRILRNRFYTGAMRYCGELHVGTHTPLVTQETFDRVQHVLTMRRTIAPRPKRLAFSFAGLMRCNECGRRMVAYTKRKKGKEYTYYACSKHMRGRCAQPQLSERQLFEAITPALQRLTIASQDLALIERMLDDAETAYVADAATIRARIEADRAALATQRARIVDLLVDGTLAKADADRKIRELAERDATLQLSLNEAGRAVPGLEPARSFFRALPNAANVFAEGSAETQRTLLQQLGFELEARGKEALVHVGRPAQILIDRGDHPVTWRIVEVVRYCVAFHQALFLVTRQHLR